MKYIDLLKIKRAIKILCILFATTVISCSDDYKENPLDKAQLMTGINLSVTNPLKLAIGMDSLVIATPIPDNITYDGITWSSADEGAVSVTQDGLLSAKAIGTTYINLSQTSAFSSLTSLRVQVMPIATSVALGDVSVYGGASQTVPYTVTPSGAYDDFIWKSSDESLVMIDRGIVIATQLPEGAEDKEVIITAFTNDGSHLSATAKVTVKAPIALENIILNPLGYDMMLGETTQLTCKLEPTDATVEMLEWSSSDENILTVDVSGKVTALSAGTATITAKDRTSDCFATIDVTVGIGVLSHNFDSSLGNWIFDGGVQTSEFFGDHMLVTMSDNSKYYGPFKLNNVTLNVGTYRYCAIKMLRPGAYTEGGNANGTIFLDTPKGRYLQSSGFGNNQYNVVGYDSPASAPTDEPVVLYFDLQQPFGDNYRFSQTGTETIDFFKIGIYDIPSNLFSNTYEVYWIHTFNTLEEMNTFVENNK
ncbi:Ig-like domain-containing protein [Bacteroides finegoldii]|uniref:Ig-like domain-containing protein n=1 Tax=Bacteroides finegoldii TaxID=338188 RepID=UPI00189D0B91|nr:Ig-like domain-containing protein [Bacteroides finegoldii]